MKEKIYIIGSTAHSIINFRYDLINCLRKTFKILVLSQDYNNFTNNKLKNINVEYYSYGSNKFKFLHEIISFFNLSKFLFLPLFFSFPNFTEVIKLFLSEREIQPIDVLKLSLFILKPYKKR